MVQVTPNDHDRKTQKVRSPQKCESLTTISAMDHSILNAMSKQTILVSFHVAAFVCLMVLPLGILQLKENYWVGSAMSFVHSFIIYLMFPCANKFYNCLCFSTHKCCVGIHGFKRSNTNHTELSQSNTKICPDLKTSP